MKFTTNTPEETLKFGYKLGKKLHEGAIISLNGEFGTGKTWLSKGIAFGLDVPEHEYVNSPAFDLVHEYEGKYPVYHIDFYRLETLSEEDYHWLVEYIDGNGICLIEWGDKFIDKLIGSYLRIELNHVNFSDKREIIITARGENYEKLLKELNDDSTWN